MNEDEGSHSHGTQNSDHKSVSNLSWLIHDLRAELGSLQLQVSLLSKNTDRQDITPHIAHLSQSIRSMVQALSIQPPAISQPLLQELDRMQEKSSNLIAMFAHNPEIVRRACKIEQASQRMRELIDAAAQRPPSEAFCVNDLAREMSTAFEERCRERSIIIHLRLDSGLRMINAVRTEIVAVLRNICMNAIEAMPDGGELTIETRNAETISDMLTKDKCPPHMYPDIIVNIIDTGVGMSETMQRMLFDDKVHVSTKGQGRGLGLHLIDQMVRRNNGAIQIGSAPGRGTRFQLLFCSTTP